MLSPTNTNTHTITHTAQYSRNGKKKWVLGFAPGRFNYDVSEWCRGIASAEDSIDELAEKLSNPKQKKTQRHAGAVVSVEDLEAPEEGSNRKRKLYEEVRP
eukprot:244867-Pelagomonas_calceolata.AAC.1